MWLKITIFCLRASYINHYASLSHVVHVQIVLKLTGAVKQT